jgi:hypothetical protein
MATCCLQACNSQEPCTDNCENTQLSSCNAKCTNTGCTNDGKGGCSGGTCGGADCPIGCGCGPSDAALPMCGCWNNNGNGH